MWHWGLGLHSLRQFFYDSHFIMSSVDFQVWELYVYMLYWLLLRTSGSLALGRYFKRTSHLFCERCTPQALTFPRESLKPAPSNTSQHVFVWKQWLLQTRDRNESDRWTMNFCGAHKLNFRGGQDRHKFLLDKCWSTRPWYLSGSGTCHLILQHCRYHSLCPTGTYPIAKGQKICHHFWRSLIFWTAEQYIHHWPYSVHFEMLLTPSGLLSSHKLIIAHTLLIVRDQKLSTAS